MFIAKVKKISAIIDFNIIIIAPLSVEKESFSSFSFSFAQLLIPRYYLFTVVQLNIRSLQDSAIQ